MLPFRLEPDLRPRVWGGTRLAPAGLEPVGEAWLAGPWSRVRGGPAHGSTLEELVGSLGVRLTGAHATLANRFPFLVTILDPAAWLSVQVHPNDEQARRLEGPGAVRKTEAWDVREATTGAEILLGVEPSVQPETVRRAIREGGLADLLQRRRVAAAAVVCGAGWEERLERFETSVIPADAGGYPVAFPQGGLGATTAPVVLLARPPQPGERSSRKGTAHADPA